MNMNIETELFLSELDSYPSSTQKLVSVTLLKEELQNILETEIEPQPRPVSIDY